MPQIILLGPQRPNTNLGAAIVEAALPDGPLAVISAGWQEAEGDIEDIHELVRRPLHDLRLYQRAEEVFAAAPELLLAYRARQDRLQVLQRLYRLRLRRLLSAARQMLRAKAEPSLVEAEQRHAIAQLRALDRHHMRRVAKVNERFDAEFDVAAHELLSRQAAEISGILDNVETVVITGGNVAILINRLRLFGLGNMLKAKNVVAWSAGAMALCDRIVLFHDNPPQGRRNPEVFGPGLGLVRRQVLFPNARTRLRTSDRVRMQLLGRRFAPAACITLDSGAMLRIADGQFVAVERARRIVESGRLRKVKTP
ncbi:MAG TPA: Type 1 glutamine amidotransferase-like domain-containing protein [Woeseiaceae bacterium]|nr:Type 1 glutamine amidotransferase-like domain-containing protein [Woeseiaceae bacterium]